MTHSILSPRPIERAADFVVRAMHASLLAVGFVVALLFITRLIAGEIPAFARAWAERGATTVAAGQEMAGLQAAAAESGLDIGLRSVADTIARRYRIAMPAVEDIVRLADATARSARLDPLLVLAVIGVESRFNPYAESPFGAQGLMQIIGRYHLDKFTPTPDGFALLDPETNIQVGVQILREYLQRTGDLNAALKLYGGETDGSGVGYAEKVHAEKERLLQAVQRSRRA